MFAGIAKALFGSANDRYVKSTRTIVEGIAALEADMTHMTSSDLERQTVRFRDRLASGEDLDALLPEAFATVREASRRVLRQRHYDVQMIGGIVLHRGEIAEMRTGEGKTLVATLATYLNALPAKGVHVVTVNDYLAARDAETMGQVYRFLGMTVGVVAPGMTGDERRAAYAADITYGTNNEFGFDYLRDNMKFDAAEKVQRPFAYAIVDEVDSILIDEARTPLIIAGPTEDGSDLYMAVDAIAKRIVPEDYDHDEKRKSVVLTDEATEKVERMLEKAGLLDGTNLYDFENTQVVHHLDLSLRANVAYRRDIDYVVRDGRIVVVDEFTGRMMEGRRWSDGLHQAVEAKEGVPIQPENRTLAAVTFQNYFRMYPKMGGMTGTAATEAAEFHEIYRMPVVTIPTNLPVRRIDDQDQFYRNAEEKFAAIARTIRETREKGGQPVLVGTVSIEKSEMLSAYLRDENVPHAVLNALYHENEAHVVAQAGRLGSVTIATNMAGRGTDIQLGGNLEFRMADEHPELLPDTEEHEAAAVRIRAEIAAEKKAVQDAGGLLVLGTERHESRRIDNQLRGRSGRQGDPGMSRFYLSLDDDLLRIFGADSMLGRMMNSNMDEGQSLSSPMFSKAIEKAQRRVETHNYDIRKQVVEYDDVVNDQRRVVYGRRSDLLASDDVGDLTMETLVEVVTAMIDEQMAMAYPEGDLPDRWDAEALISQVRDVFAIEPPIAEWLTSETMDPNTVQKLIEDAVKEHLHAREVQMDPTAWQGVMRGALLHALDEKWREHIAMLDALRQVVHLRAYAQKNPLVEYKREAFATFERMLASTGEAAMRTLCAMDVRTDDAIASQEMDATGHDPASA